MSYSPVRRSVKHFHISASMFASLNLHVLRTPPAFILSQDQTLSNFLTSSDSYFFPGSETPPDYSGFAPHLYVSPVNPLSICSPSRHTFISNPVNSELNKKLNPHLSAVVPRGAQQRIFYHIHLICQALSSHLCRCSVIKSLGKWSEKMSPYPG